MDMDAELTRLAASGATLLVQRMVGDGWDHARDRLAQFFTRGRGGGSTSQNIEALGEGGEGGGEEAALRALQEELDTSREELIAAHEAGNESSANDVQAEWRSRLRRTLRADPRLLTELRSLIDELTPQTQRGEIRNTYNTISGGVHHGIVIQSGSMGEMNVRMSPQDPPPGG